MATVQCANCGAQNRDTGRFCTVCGAALPASVTSQPPAQPPPAQAAPPVTPPPAAGWAPTGSAPALAPVPTAEQFSATIRGFFTPLAPLGKQIPAWAGALLLLIGIFLPVTAQTEVKGTAADGSTVTIVPANYAFWDHDKFTFFVLLGIVIATAILAVTRRYNGLRVCALLAVTITAIFFFDLLTGGISNPSWAFLLLWPGSLLITLASQIPDTGRGITFSSMMQYNQPPGAAR